MMNNLSKNNFSICTTPGSSKPRGMSRTTPRSKTDRFIPDRGQLNMNLCRTAYSNTHGPKPSPVNSEYNRWLMSTLYNVPIDTLDGTGMPKKLLSFGEPRKSTVKTSRGVAVCNPFDLDFLRATKLGGSDDHLAYSSPTKEVRKLPNKPFRVLDAPNMVNDFYATTTSWSKDNLLAVSLGGTVYLWDPSNAHVSLLHECEEEETVTNVCWCDKRGATHLLAVGTNQKNVLIFDTQTQQVAVRFVTNTDRQLVWALSWNDKHQLTAGLSTGQLAYLDLSTQSVRLVEQAHPHGVTSVLWHTDGRSMATGGNDNAVRIWDGRMDTGTPRLLFAGHKAAIKGMAWSPVQREVIATGGGAADRTLQTWNTISGRVSRHVQTNSQVTSLHWTHTELISCHGYERNEINVWNRNLSSNIQVLPGHTSRIVSSALSPDLTTLVTAGADEVLKFWKISESSFVSCNNDNLASNNMLTFSYRIR